MNKIGLWEYIRSEIHNEQPKKETNHQCPLATLLEKNKIQERDMVEKKPWPKYPCFESEIFPWK